MDWAAWGPTIVSFITCIFFAGIVYQRQNAHADKLKEHDENFQDQKRELELIKSTASLQAVKIGMLEAWRDGYAAAKAAYDRTLSQHQPAGGD